VSDTDSYFHAPPQPSAHNLILTHGAGSNFDAPLLKSIAGALASRGVGVLRMNLAYRRHSPKGPPGRASGATDRADLAAAVERMRADLGGSIYLGGHSYGGRQSTMLAAERPDLVDGLLILSYPLRPPRKPAEIRTNHFPGINARALFVHGTRDPFGSAEDLQAALSLIPSETELYVIGGAGHDLTSKRRSIDSGEEPAVFISEAFCRFFKIPNRNESA
jgi:predicted alpha/beta-hydrolase family hydrolase